MGEAEPTIVNLDTVLERPDVRDENQHGALFQATLGLVGKALGTSQIGMTLTVTPPGKAAWPRHFHHVNEEVIIVLSGEGVLRYGEARHPLKPHDVVRIAPGTGVPFHVVNESEADLRYLVLSGLSPTDVFEYPDSGKIGLVTGGNGPMRGPHGRIAFFRLDASLPYWSGEDG